jgi:hypothetical protein
MCRFRCGNCKQCHEEQQRLDSLRFYMCLTIWTFVCLAAWWMLNR